MMVETVLSTSATGFMCDKCNTAFRLVTVRRENVCPPDFDPEKWAPFPDGTADPGGILEMRKVCKCTK